MTAHPAGEAVLARRAAIRLGVQAAALAALLVVVLTAAAGLILIHAQRTQVSAQLDSAIAHADDVEDPPSGTFLVLRTADGAVHETPGLPAGVADRAALADAAGGGSPPAVERNVGEIQYEISTMRRPDGVTVQAILDLTANHAERNRLLGAMLAIGLAGLLVSGVAGTWLGHRAMTPLSAALALQRRFVADAGHELRTPLTLLGTRAQLLRRRLRRDPTSDQRLLDEIEGVVGDSRRLTAILEDLLLAADPLAERPREPVDLVALCRAVLAAAQAEAGNGGEITLHLDAPGSVSTLGSEAALGRAVTALVDNAVRHARRAVRVEIRADDGHAVVEVRDDGDGVDPTQVPRLFDRFATAARPIGTGRRPYGLGLALVAEIAAAHEGRVDLVSAAGDGGAVFRLTLPGAPVPVPRNL
jgi:signal transduction histidine kinase